MEREKEQLEYQKQQLLQERQAFMHEQAMCSEARSRQAKQQQAKQQPVSMQTNQPMYHAQPQYQSQPSKAPPMPVSHDWYTVAKVLASHALEFSFIVGKCSFSDDIE